MNFQITVLKILVSYPDGFAVMADLKRDMAILATSGRDWSERTKRLAERVPGLNIFSQGLIGRESGGWKITDKGRAVLAYIEGRPGAPREADDLLSGRQARTVLNLLRVPSERAVRRRQRRERRKAGERGRGGAH